MNQMLFNIKLLGTMVERFSRCELMASHCKTLSTNNIVVCKHNKRRLGCQGLNHFQALHLTCDIHVLIYNIKIFIFHIYLKHFFEYILVLYNIYYASMFFNI
jgi:hypothetical protein